MTAKSIPANELLRRFHAVESPIYALDDKFKILFLNHACQDWLKIDPQNLLGTSATYHTSSLEKTPEEIAARLCPPPSILEGHPCTATVGYLDANHLLKRRLTRFIPLTFEGETSLILALVDPTDLPDNPNNPDSSLLENENPSSEKPSDLHDALLRFRQELAGRYSADRLLGKSPAMRLARQQYQVAVQTRCNVNLVGPQGSGRQHLAATIHYGGLIDLAKTTHNAFVPLDCSILAGDFILSTIEALLRSADASKAAHNTLVLARLDDIPAELQVELAAMIVKKPFPIRILSTSISSLQELAERGHFREDLAATLSTMTILLPPLIRRRTDIPLLAQAFLEECNASESKQISGFTSEALDQLDAYAWPGNLDELWEMVTAAHTKTTNRLITPDDLPERLHLAQHAKAFPRRSDETIILDDYLARVERELIRRALAQAKENKAKAARLLGLTRPRLYRKMVQLGMETPTGTSKPKPSKSKPDKSKPSKSESDRSKPDEPKHD